MKYNFDEIIDRKNTNALNTDGFRSYIFNANASMHFKYDDEDFIRMWVADMEFAVLDVILDAMKSRIDKRIFGYTRIFSDEYYKAFSNWCIDRYGWNFLKEELVMSNGIIPALYELVSYITNNDDKVLLLTPSYAYFKYAADFHGRESVCSDLKCNEGYYEIDYDDFETKASDPKMKLFILCHPHNPTGRVWKEKELHRLAEICVKNDLWIISDEIHCDLLREGFNHIPLGKILPSYPKLITCMAPSKTFNLAGLMISNIIIRDNDLRDLWLARHYNFDNPISIAGAEAAYNHGSEWLNELCKYLDKNFKYTKDYIDSFIPKVKFRISEATYLAWIDVSEYFDESESLTMFFANEAGVLLESDNMFVQNADFCIRLNLACPMSVLKEGLKRISQALADKP